jgi:hypothetical protein
MQLVPDIEDRIYTYPKNNGKKIFYFLFEIFLFSPF